jgi:hypothetical protein
MRTSSAKLAARDQRKAQMRERRVERRSERQCFWTWPLGHEYVGDACVECGRPIRERHAPASYHGVGVRKGLGH